MWKLKKSKRINYTLFSFTLSASLLAGCQATNPSKATVIAQPDTPIVKNITGFTNSLRCMDELFLQYGKHDIVITSDGLPDQTGEISAGTKDMMITSLSKMSEKSEAFRFVDIEQGGAVEFIQARVGKGFAVPDFYIRGAVTQIDRNVVADSNRLGGGLPWLALSYSKDQLLSLMTVDVNIGDTIKRQIIPGLHTTNTITIVRSGSGFDSEGIIEKASLFFEISQDRAQGTHQSLRTLIELSLIEVLGKLTRVPYWRCLGLESTNPSLIAQARDWYDSITRDEQVKVIQSALASTGFYRGPADGKEHPEFTQAVQHYQAQNDLISNGRVDFDLYYRLLVDNRAVVPDVKYIKGKRDQAEPSYHAIVAPAGTDQRNGGEDAIGLKVEPLNGTQGNYAVGDELYFKLSVAQAATVHCYYEYVEGDRYYTARIFPNRWQQNALVSPNRPVVIPNSDADFKLIINAGGVREQVACIARPEWSTNRQFPKVFAQQDLVPVEGTTHLFQVVDAYQAIEQYESTVQSISWQVK